MSRAALILAAALVAASGTLAAQCGFLIPGQGAPAVLSVAASPFCVSAEPSCLAGCMPFGNLTIHPGVTIRVDPGVMVVVLGTLQALGTPGAPITFTERVSGAGWGGLVLVGTGSVMENCIVEHARDSGIRILDAGATLRNTTVRNCSTPGQGGGLRIDQQGFTGTVILQGCNILDNTSGGSGGGIRANLGNSALSMTSTVVQGNAANPANAAGDYAGGGMYLSTGPQGLADLSHCSFADNSARSQCSGVFCGAVARGGGIYADGPGTLNIRHSLFRFNELQAQVSAGGTAAGAQGGGLYSHGGLVWMSNSVVAGNRVIASSITGCGIFIASGSLDIVNSTIANNLDSHGIFRLGGTVSLRNSILWGNGPGVMSPTDAQISPAASPEISVSHSCIQGTLQPGWISTINIDPVFKEPSGTAPWQLAIEPASPCVDAGDPATFDPCFGPASLPGLGTALADMGHFGGDQNCGWYPWTTPGSSLVLDAPSNPPAPGQPFRFIATGAPPGPGMTATAIVGLSCSGTAPGIPTGDGRLVPLVMDACTVLGLSLPLLNFFTAPVSASGTASTAYLLWPSLPPGTTFYISAIIADSQGAITTITAPIRIAI